jgi:hypothetical protein
MSGGIRRRGDNAIVIGLGLLVFGIVITGAVAGGAGGLGVFIAVAGLVTGLVGVGMKREKPARD